MASVTLLDYGAGNVRSVVRAFEHGGAEVRVTADPGEAEQAERLVLPGQGHFGQCMGQLRERGLDDAIRTFVTAGRPFLGICVGEELLFAGSEEAPGIPGLALLPGTVRRLPVELPLPHMGWSSVEWTERAGDDPLLTEVVGPGPVFFYHAHSYAVQDARPEHLLGVAEYGGIRFASVVGTEQLWGVQFHPEKSQEFGLRLLANFARL